MRLVVAALVASTGCAQIAGIDNTSGLDANTDFASVQMQRVSVGASVSKSPLDLTAQTATFYDDSAGAFAAVAGTPVPPDSFTADVAGTPAALVTLPPADTTIARQLFETGARAQRGSVTVYAPPNAQPALPSSALDLAVTLPSAYVSGENFSIQAIGPWAQRALAAGELPLPDMGLTTIDPPPIAYSELTSMVGRSVPRITVADVVLVLRYAAAHLTGVFQTQLDQTDGPDMVAGAMTAVAETSTLTATITPSAYQQRFNAINPALGATSMSWRLTAAPGWSAGDSQGVRLVNGSAVDTDTQVTTMYGNPFQSLDWKALFVFTAVASRTYTVTDGTSSANVGLLALMTTTTDAGAATIDVSMPAGLPITITLQGTPLTTDGQTVALDVTQPVTVDAVYDRTTNTGYSLSLVQLGLDTTGPSPIVTRTNVLDAVLAGGTKFRIPGGLLEQGKLYIVQVRAFVGGFTEIATGDVQTVSLPYTYTSVDSAVFIPGAP